jgi:hypothetical protein
MKSLEEANERVGFWKSWLETIALLPPTDARKAQQEIAEDQIIRASSEVTLLYKKETPQEQYDAFVERRQRLSALRRRLLFYRPLNARAWVSKLLFYAYLLGAPLIAYSLLSLHLTIARGTALRGQELKSDAHAVAMLWRDYRGSIVRFDFVSILVVVAIVLIGLLFRLRSMRVETDGYPVSLAELSSVKYRLWPKTEAKHVPS